jgi:hypothetical protein
MKAGCAARVSRSNGGDETPDLGFAPVRNDAGVSDKLRTEEKCPDH